MKKKFLLLFIPLLLTACGTLEDLSLMHLFSPSDTEEGPAPTAFRHPADISIPMGKKIVVAATNFSDPVGSISSIDPASNYTASTMLASTNGTDVVLRSFNNKIFIINRWGSDSIQVLNSGDFGIMADYSVGAGSNPQDIWVMSDEKAYVTRLDAQNDTELSDDVLVINPMTGERLGSLDLTSYTQDDGDRLARAAQMTAVGEKLFICVQDLPGLWGGADTNGKVVAIDTNTNEILGVIQLSGRDPADITYSPLTGLVYVTNSGVLFEDPDSANFSLISDLTDSYGGIEEIDPGTLQSNGIVIDDQVFGGYPTEIRISSENLGYAIVGNGQSAKIVSFNPSTHALINDSFYISSANYIPDFSLEASSGDLIVTDMSVENPGIIVIGEDGTVKTGPISVGAPPSSITFVDTQ